MASLALAVTILVSPAMFGGPIALLLSLFRPDRMSGFRRIFILVLALLSSVIGIFLIIENISRGSTTVGALGLSTGLGALWQLKRHRGQTP
jgi:disulfide bond formation protein DsbB